MPSLVELQYNPYIPQVRILIDGVQTSDFSRLIQYADEDIWYWAHEIMDTIYAEIRNDFFVSFTGTPQDANVVQIICEKYQHCIGFRKNDFIVSEPLPKRMIQLNKLIKKAEIATYEKTIIDALFFLPTAFHKYMDEILSLDINNLFCAVRAQVIGTRVFYEEANNSVLFIFAENREDGYEYIQKLSGRKPAFVLIFGNDDRILEITDSGWFFQTTESTLFNTIFACFVQMPLVIAFRKCVQSIKGGNKVSKELQLISGVEPVIHVIVEKEVEVGRSIRLTTFIEPAVATSPNLIYKIKNPNIASCDGMNIYGLREGICVLEVYKNGGKTPFYTKEIRVFQRNRITNIILSDDTLIVGLNDCKKIGIEYFPENADNIDTISWQSSDSNIIKVDSNGQILALGVGNCRIICTAENISAQCICTVKPYLEELKINMNFEEDGVLYMTPLQEMVLEVECVPQDCIDSDLKLLSSNSDVVNVVNNTLYAKNSGYATITVQNISARISRKFTVSVKEKTASKKKSGFFRSLFNL